MQLKHLTLLAVTVGAAYADGHISFCNKRLKGKGGSDIKCQSYAPVAGQCTANVAQTEMDVLNAGVSIAVTGDQYCRVYKYLDCREPNPPAVNAPQRSGGNMGRATTWIYEPGWDGMWDRDWPIGAFKCYPKNDPARPKKIIIADCSQYETGCFGFSE